MCVTWRMVHHDRDEGSASYESLTWLLPLNQVYIIGGMVDHNRYKGHTHAIAIQDKVATARYAKVVAHSCAGRSERLFRRVVHDTSVCDDALTPLGCRLPIEGNVAMGDHRKVLTVNHVFELLLRKHEGGEVIIVLEIVPSHETSTSRCPVAKQCN